MNVDRAEARVIELVALLLQPGMARRADAFLAVTSARSLDEYLPALLAHLRSALPPGASKPQKAKTPRCAGTGSSVQNPISGGSNHGIPKV